MCPPKEAVALGEHTACIAATVPPVDESERLTLASDHGNPIRRFSMVDSSLFKYLET